MTRVKPYIMVSNAKKALEAYSEVFNAELIARMKFAPGMGLPDDYDYENSTMHCSFKLGEAVLFMADDVQNEYVTGGKVDIMVEPETLDEMRAIYHRAEKAGWTIDQKLEKMYWGDWYCRVTDPFGVSWQMDISDDKQ
ncbi:MAG: glyoxalase/bleomycin resistance/extradiol dioxygenase family protein [Candidatus Heimdallarchaeota archaeon]|nr:glyoxalase/bleomycin resistance/extradiol dioxygenase family protein [Candidatus Heimdallarchaeota archaeon]